MLRAYLRQREWSGEYAAAQIQHVQKAMMEIAYNYITLSLTQPLAFYDFYQSKMLEYDRRF